MVWSKHAARKIAMFEHYNFNYYEARHQDHLRESEHRRAIAQFNALPSRLSLLAKRVTGWMNRRATEHEQPEEVTGTTGIYSTATLRRMEQIR
jgi:hypothetical protein